MKQSQKRQVGSSPIHYGTIRLTLLQWNLWEYLLPLQMQLLAKDLMVVCQMVQQNFCEAQDRLSRLQSTLEKIHLVG